MKNEKLLDAIGSIDDNLVHNAVNDTFGKERANHRQSFHRIPIALVAAILALLLMGAGVAAIVYGDSIQSWFNHYWGVITGQSMSEEHTAIIERLSQDIGMSQTIDNVTVTVDSATIGNNNLFILLKVKGLQHNNDVGYEFGEMILDVASDPAQGENSLSGYGIIHRDWDGDGTALLLMEYTYTSDYDNKNDTLPINLELTLTDLIQSADTDNEKVLAEGEWHFEFSLDRNEAIQVLQLSDAEIIAFDSNKNELVPIIIKNIELSSTGFNFQYDYKQGTIAIEDSIKVVLNNGKIVGESGGSGAVMKDGTTLNCSHQWQLPINLDDVSGIKIGEVVIPVP